MTVAWQLAETPLYPLIFLLWHPKLIGSFSGKSGERGIINRII